MHLSQLHHKQKTVTSDKLNPKETIKIPFLPTPQGKASVVKSNTHQLLKKEVIENPVQYQNQNQVKKFTDHILPEKPIILQQVIQLSSLSRETNSNQLLTTLQSVQNTLKKSSESKVMQSQVKSNTETPLTLSSMAGIELTGADISLLQADMSGAMPPTATVEEINVPVFINEYVEEATTPITSATINNIFNISNNNIDNTIGNANHSNAKGNEGNNFLDTVHNFDFDINMLTENCDKNKKSALEEDEHNLHQQQQLAEVGDYKEHQLELQMMLENILFNNNDNNKRTSGTFNDSNNYNTAENIDLTDDIFKVAPYTEVNDFLSPDDIENSNFGNAQFNSEEAIDLNVISQDFSLGDCFINSQPTEIMFSSGYSQPQTSSQNLIYEISQAEPHIIPKLTPIAITSGLETVKMEECDLNGEVDSFYSSACIKGDRVSNCKELKLLATTSLKRNNLQRNKENMIEKRLKLCLDTKSCNESVADHQSDINTPKVIDFIDQFNEGSMGPTAVDSIKSIYYDLISSSPKSVSVKSEINMDDSTTEFSPPNTPFSMNSISNQNSFINTAPCSPASSIAATSCTSIGTKRGRGRPAKTHSDMPHPSQIQHLTESEQKKVLERAKNNEASRKSRLKHKERDNALEREEAELKNRNEELEREWEEWTKMERKLKHAVKRQYFQFQNDL